MICEDGIWFSVCILIDGAHCLNIRLTDAPPASNNERIISRESIGGLTCGKDAYKAQRKERERNRPFLTTFEEFWEPNQARRPEAEYSEKLQTFGIIAPFVID